MVDALVSGASALRHVGSSPILGTKKRPSIGRFFASKETRSADRSSSQFMLLLMPRALGEPAFAYTFTLLYHLQDAPEGGEGYYAKYSRPY